MQTPSQTSESPSSQQLPQGSIPEILAHVDSIHSFLTNAGIPARAHTPKALKALQGTGPEKHQMILNDLGHWKSILAGANIGQGKVNERALAKKALKYFNLKLKDEAWLNEPDDEIIEFYTPRGIQFYRSLNFFDTCGYSLLDLCVNEWFVLWERPKAIVEKLHALVAEILSGTKKDTAVNISPHLVREIYDDEMVHPFCPRSTLVEFKDTYPAYGPGGDIAGIVITCRATLQSEGDDALKVAFI